MTTLREYINHLQALESEHGPLLQVEKWMPAKGRHPAPRPTLSYARTYPSRGGMPAFYHESDNPVQKGSPVIRV